MKLFDGTLCVETIRGKHGPFNVGKLITDIGVFKVKDKELDQFEPGEYTGKFWVEKVTTASNPWRGGYFTEIVAKIAEGGFLIDDEQAPSTHPGEAQAEPDPLDAERHDGPPPVTPPLLTPSGESDELGEGTASAPAMPTPEPLPVADEEADLKLFGLEIYDLFVAGDDISLDPTVDREQFRMQRDRLKASGYRFRAQSQVWCK